MIYRTMLNAHEYALPLTPPPDALSELDAAARVLDDLTLRAVALTIDLDEQTRSVRIEVGDGSGLRRLTPTQLFDVLAGC